MAADRSMTEREEIAKNVLAYGKALAPDRFPKPDPLTLQAWATVLGEIRVPPQVWPEAISWWSMNSVGDRMVTPRELKEAAQHIVRDVWETDPEKKQWLEEFRARRIDAKLGDRHGAMDALEGDRQVKGEITSSGDDQSWRETRAEIVRRARVNKQQRTTDAASSELFADMNKQPDEIRQKED